MLCAAASDTKLDAYLCFIAPVYILTSPIAILRWNLPVT
jgi:hypothetical protein